MNSVHKTIVANFIEEIWNQKQVDKIDKYLAAHFIDHSLPPALPANKEGTIMWIIGTGKSFEHTTLVDDMVSEEGKVALKIRMQMKHVGIWRQIEPTHLEIETVGYRLFKLADNKITEHWALIDGNAMEMKLRETATGTKSKNP